MRERGDLGSRRWVLRARMAPAPAPVNVWHAGGRRLMLFAFLVSLMVHVSVLLVLALALPQTRAVGWRGVSLSVSLVGMPGPAAGSSRPGPVATPPPEKPAGVAAQKKPESPSAKRIVPTRTAPENKPATASGAATVPTAEADSLAGRGLSASGPGAGSGSGSSLRVSAQAEGGSFAYDYYLQAVAAKISEVWTPPSGLAGREGETSVTIRFRILARGSVPLAEVESPSGLEFFDRSAREAVLRAQPLPPLPPAYGGRWLTVHLKFSLGAPES